jgi:hypothetical protein
LKKITACLLCMAQAVHSLEEQLRSITYNNSSTGRQTTLNPAPLLFWRLPLRAVIPCWRWCCAVLPVKPQYWRLHITRWAGTSARPWRLWPIPPTRSCYQDRNQTIPETWPDDAYAVYIFKFVFGHGFESTVKVCKGGLLAVELSVCFIWWWSAIFNCLKTSYVRFVYEDSYIFTYISASSKYNYGSGSVKR